MDGPPLIYSEASFKASFYNLNSHMAGKKPLPVILSSEQLSLSDRNILLFLFEVSTHMNREDAGLP